MPEENKQIRLSEEKLSSEVVALCALLAQIMMRCLREKNPRILGLLSLPSPQLGNLEVGENHDAVWSS